MLLWQSRAGEWAGFTHLQGALYKGDSLAGARGTKKGKGGPPAGAAQHRGDRQSLLKVQYARSLLADTLCAGVHLLHCRADHELLRCALHPGQSLPQRKREYRHAVGASA
jgi:hypothetical protein